MLQIELKIIRNLRIIKLLCTCINLTCFKRKLIKLLELIIYKNDTYLLFENSAKNNDLKILLERGKTVFQYWLKTFRVNVNSL